MFEDRLTELFSAEVDGVTMDGTVPAVIVLAEFVAESCLYTCESTNVGSELRLMFCCSSADVRVGVVTPGVDWPSLIKVSTEIESHDTESTATVSELRSTESLHSCQQHSTSPPVIFFNIRAELSVGVIHSGHGPFLQVNLLLSAV